MQLLKLAFGAATIFAICFLPSCKKDTTPQQQVTYSATNLPMSGAQEAPPVNTNATGSLDATYNKSTKVFTLTLRWQNLSTAPTAMHIHSPADRGISIGVVQPITGFPAQTTGSVTVQYTVNETNLKEAELLGGKWYANIHTSTNPAGEIRGQIELK